MQTVSRPLSEVIGAVREAVAKHFPDRIIEHVDARRSQDEFGEPIVFVYCQVSSFEPRSDIKRYIGARDDLVRRLMPAEYPRLYVFDKADAMAPIDIV